MTALYSSSDSLDRRSPSEPLCGTSSFHFILFYFILFYSSAACLHANNPQSSISVQSNVACCGARTPRRRYRRNRSSPRFCRATGGLTFVVAFPTSVTVGGIYAGRYGMGDQSAKVISTSTAGTTAGGTVMAGGRGTLIGSPPCMRR